MEVLLLASNARSCALHFRSACPKFAKKAPCGVVHNWSAYLRNEHAASRVRVPVLNTEDTGRFRKLLSSSCTETPRRQARCRPVNVKQSEAALRASFGLHLSPSPAGQSVEVSWNTQDTVLPSARSLCGRTPYQ
eukprot:6461705-Amphidinium_carterae.2